VSINPWSVCNKSESISDFIIDHHVDILCITETWLTGTEKDNPIIAELVPNDYSFKHNPRTARGGGTGMIYRSSLNVQPTTLAQFKCTSFEYQECLVKASKTLRLGVVYRPPGKPPGQFFEDFADLLETLSTHRGHILLTGDFNFHMEDDLDREANMMKSLLTTFGLQQHVTHATHRAGHTLDLVITRTEDAFISSVVAEDHGFTDHFPVFTKTKLQRPAASAATTTYRSIKKIDPQVVSQAILQTSLTDLHTDVPLDEQVQRYNEVLTTILDQIAPTKTRTIRIRPRAEWYNEEIRAAKQERRKAERKWRKSKQTTDRNAFLTHRQKVNDLLATTRKNFYRNIVLSCKDQKQLFKVLNKLLGRLQAVPLPPGIHMTELAEMFGQFFIKKISDIRSSIPDAVDPTPPTPPPGCTFAAFTTVTTRNIVELIASSPSKTCALDPMPTVIIKAVKEDIAPAITSIVNTSLQTGVFPAAFKNALVKPHLKKTKLDSAQPKNYRPVSNLAFVSKLLEKIVASQLLPYLAINNLMDAHQSAYRHDHSTETALLHVMDDLVRSVGSHHAVLFVALDLSAAFDTVDYNLLDAVLSSMGIQGTAATWFRTYLHGREQQVSVQDVLSEPQTLDCGVPQGSVLGPLLFSLYTTSLGRVLKKHGVRYHFYADDTQLWLPFAPGNYNDAVHTMQCCLLDVQKWMSYHKLKMNCEKKQSFLSLHPSTMAYMVIYKAPSPSETTSYFLRILLCTILGL
jgi:exonuclease III